jgi:methylmalonyl-CoA mutase
MAQLTLASDFPKAREDDWLERVAKSLRGRAFDSLVSETLDGIALQPLYRGATEPAPVRTRVPGLGEPPWTILQRLDIPDVARGRAQAREDLDNGAGGLVLVWPGSVNAGRHGIAVSTLDDLQRLTERVDLDLIALRLDAGAFAAQAIELVLDLYEARNLDLARCDISFGLDPLAALALTGRGADEAALGKSVARNVAAIAERGHRGPALMIDARVYHGAGATEAQELAAVLATAVQYLRWLEVEGHDLEDAAGRIGFLLTADADQFLTIAKLRAARALWARAVSAMGLEPEAAIVHVETAVRMMSRRDPHVNLLRTTTAAFAAGVGGADAVAVLPFTAALGLADGFARRLARGQQTLLQEESGIGRIAEAAAGSGFVEAATAELAAAAWTAFQAIEGQGGMLAGLASGFVQRRIAEAVAARRRAIAERRQGLTGVSQFPMLDEVTIEVLDVPLPGDWQGRERVENAGAMTCTPLVQERLAQPFERLRDAADAHRERTGQRPAVFLANLGPRAEFDARARWTRNLLAAGGIAAMPEEGFEAPETAAQAFEISGATIACLCASDRLYGEIGAAAAKALSAAGAARIYVAGRPDADERVLASAGVDEFLFDGIDAVAALQRLHEVLKVGGVRP